MHYQWHNNGPQDIVTVSQCIQNAINEMHVHGPYHMWRSWAGVVKRGLQV